LQFTNATISGVEFDLTDATLIADVTGGSFSGGQSHGLDLMLDNSTADFTFLNTQIDGNGLGGTGDGVNALVENQSSLILDFTGCSFDNNAGSGWNLCRTGGVAYWSTIVLSMNGTSTSSNSSSAGLHFEGTQGSSFTSSNGLAAAS